MNTNSPQHRRPVNRVERVGHVDRKCNLTRIRTVTVEPLADCVNDRLAPVRCLDPKLKRLQNNTCALRDEFHDNLAREAADSFTFCDRPKKKQAAWRRGHERGADQTDWPQMWTGRIKGPCGPGLRQL